MQFFIIFIFVQKKIIKKKQGIKIVACNSLLSNVYIFRNLSKNKKVKTYQKIKKKEKYNNKRKKKL